MIERNITDLDPYFSRFSRYDPIPNDAIYLCRYSVKGVWSEWEESAYLSRTDDTDELWVNCSSGLFNDKPTSGRVLVVKQKSNPDTVAGELLRTMFRMRSEMNLPRKFKDAGTIGEDAFLELVEQFLAELRDDPNSKSSKWVLYQGTMSGSGDVTFKEQDLKSFTIMIPPPRGQS